MLNELASSLGVLIGVTVLFCFYLLLAKLLKSVVSGRKLEEQLFTKDNPAAGLATSGYFLGVSTVFAAALVGPSAGLWTDFTQAASFGALGLVLVAFSQVINSSVLFHQFNGALLQAEQRNTGVGAVRGASYLGTGIVAAGAIAGQGGLASALVFFVLGQVTLLVFSRLYEKLSKYDLHDELAKGNAAAGFAFAGHIVAVSIIVSSSIAGDFKGWQQDISAFGFAAIIGFIMLPIVRAVMDNLPLSGRKLSLEIVEDKNPSAGMLEAAIAIGAALALAVSL